MQEQILAVQRMQDYIEEHLLENITLAQLSRASFFSPWYSHRLFVQYVGISPAQYIRKLRLSKSALKLRDNPCKIVDVAFEMGFGSVDGYQRAFFREFGCNPGDFAALPVPVYLFTPYGVKFRHVERSFVMPTVQTVFIQVLNKPARKVIMKRGVAATDYFAYCEEVGCDVWGLLQSISSISPEPVGMWLPSALQKPGTSAYVQGAEVALDYSGVVPEGCELVEMPAATFLMFQGEPFDEELYCQAIDALKASIDKYDPAIMGYAWDNNNPRIQLEPIGKRGYIELLPIKPV